MSKAQQASSDSDEPVVDQIQVPTILAKELQELRQRQLADIEQANANFNIRAGALMRGFMAGCPGIDPTATYVPNNDFTILTRQP